MRRKPEVLILVLIAVLFSFTAAQATAPIAKEIPDIRNASNTAGLTNATLVDLDEYVIDPDDRDANGLQDSSTLIWGENSTVGDDNVTVSANELQVNVPAQGTPSLGESTFVVTDQSADQDFEGATVKSTELLSAPLVDDYLGISGGASAVPYAWCLDAGETARVEPGSQPPGGGRLFVNHSDGVGQSCFYGASTVLADATAQNAPRSPNNDPVTLHGLAFGNGSSASLVSANLSTDAGLNGSFVTALTGFSDWARVTVTRKYGDGSTDSYTVAIADSLEGTTTNLSGLPENAGTTAGGLLGSENFEGITIQDFLGNTVAGFNTELGTASNTPVSRAAQKTAWDVRGQGTAVPPLEITSVGKPAATFPGATDGRALHMTLSQQDGTGIIAFHKGIPDTNYDAGDVLTFSLSVFVDLNYDTVNDDEINEGSNGITIAMALADQLTVSMGNFNYVDFPPTQAAYNAQAGINLAGNHDYTNKSALLHGKWTRHQVSWRVPQIGQSVTGGPGVPGTGNLVDVNGVTAAWTILRADTRAPVNQDVWVDNLCITNCPGPLCYALGAIQAPMISAGWAFEIANGANSSALPSYPAYAAPPSVNRTAVINGNFSTSAGTASVSYPASGQATFFRASQNAASGWLDAYGSLGAGAAAYIGAGLGNVALGFPIGFDESLVLDSVTTNAGGGTAKVVSPYLDMGLIDQALNPGLHVATAAFAAGSGGPSTLDQIVNNVSGIYGLRFTVRADGAAPSNNPAMYAVLCNGDVTNGLVAQAGSQVLPNGADSVVGAGVVWADYFLEGSVISFHSPQTVAKGIADGAVTPGVITADNPGRQTAQVQLLRAANNNAGLVGLQLTALGNGYEDYLGEVTLPGTAPQQAAAPGANGQADLFVDEVGLYTVRDTGSYYDEDLTVSSLLP